MDEHEQSCPIKSLDLCSQCRYGDCFYGCDQCVACAMNAGNWCRCDEIHEHTPCPYVRRWPD